MSEWIVYGKDGLTEKCRVKNLQYVGEFMGACSLTVNISSPSHVNFEFGDYMEYRGERFEINYDPSVVKQSAIETDGEGFVYDSVVFNSLSDELTRCDFLDYVSEDNNLHYSSLPVFSFFAADISKLAERIQVNLDRIYTGDKKWTVVVHPEYVNAKNVNIQVSNNTVWDALGFVNSKFGANFIVRGRVITIGTSGIAVGTVFSYGKGNGLFKIERNAESSQKVITRLRAYGSTKNMPNGYYRNADGGNIPNNMSVKNLMLPSFPVETHDPYIDSKNIEELGIREGTVFFDGSGDMEEIYPTMEGITAEQLKDAGISVSSSGALDEVVDAEQITDNGVFAPTEDGDSIEIPPFTITLKDIGFDINDYLSESSAIISMTDGMCGGRDFEIIGCKKSGNNYVLTCNRNLDEGLDLYFPYNEYQIKPGDKFILLGIEMPDVYIKAASERLLNAAKEYLSKNDYVRYSYTLSIDSVFMARQHDDAIKNGGTSIHDTIKEGDLMIFEDEDLGINGSITISSISIKEYLNESLIPEYEITLKDEKTVGAIDKLQNQIESLKNSSSSSDSAVNTRQVQSIVEAYGNKNFLRKNKDDRSSGIIASDKGFEAGNLVKGATGAGVYKDANNNWVVETDNLKVRKKLSSSDVDIQTTNHIGGQMMLTAASMNVDYVVESDNYYRCYFLKKDSDGNVINNEWKIGDQAYCNTFNLEKQADGTIGNHYYWRKVVGKSSGNEADESIVVGDETINASDYHYVDLSKDDCAVDSSIPKNGDKVVHLGYQGTDDLDRQNAIVIAGAGSGSPYIQLFVGINSYSLPEPEQLKPNDNRLSGVLNIKGGSTGWQNFEGLPEEIQKAVDAAEEAKSSYENLEYGKNNLLRNSGFTGDYVTASLGGDTSLKETSQMFSPSLKYWGATNATAQESELSESGKEVLILSGGSLQQTMFFKVIANEKYIFSFRGKGQSITFSVGGYVENISLTSEWASYVSKFTTSFEGQIFSIRVTGDCTLCELQLERGTIKSAWGLSPLDNRSELAKYDSLTYLSNLLKATTTIMGGVVNTGYINMGNLNDDGELAETTAGVSGIYNDESSVAYFAGGNLEKAIYTVATYIDNPNYTPTQEELNNMAKFVVTHGGRAILNDIILRGYIYTLGGYFKGEINAEKGVFKNVKSPNGNFEIDDYGNVSIVGTFETSIGNKRIRIDAENQEIVLYDELGRKTAKMSYLGDVGESWTYGMIELMRYVGDSETITFYTQMLPNGIIIEDNTESQRIRSSYTPEGVSVTTLSGTKKEYGAGVQKKYSDATTWDWESFVNAGVFKSGTANGLSTTISINAGDTTHTFTFTGGILTNHKSEYTGGGN